MQRVVLVKCGVNNSTREDFIPVKKHSIYNSKIIATTDMFSMQTMGKTPENTKKQTAKSSVASTVRLKQAMSYK
jgi:hypothetical protein